MIPFDLESLRHGGFVRQIEYLEEAPSTSAVAVSLAQRDDVHLPLLVLTPRQTAGRGRGQNRWWSSEGALTFSLVLDAAASGLRIERRPLVSLAAGLSVCETLAALAPGHHLGVKWPNDVHLDGKKICGVLVETARGGDRLVVGIGINVNNSLAEAPPEVAERAIALADVLGEFLNLGDVLARVLERFSFEWRSLQDADNQLVERLRTRCTLSGRCVAMDLAGERIAGLCRGIADDGSLLIETEIGPRRCYAGVATAME
jgi:BirA family biotin operon repressor/biotin-[acetyl-CoA-carboxylase] ligase